MRRFVETTPLLPRYGRSYSLPHITARSASYCERSQSSWKFGILNLRQNHKKKNARISRLDLKISSDPGLHPVESVHTLCPEGLEIRKTVQQHFTSECSIRDLDGPLITTIQSLFPKYHRAEITYIPDLKLLGTFGHLRGAEVKHTSDTSDTDSWTVKSQWIIVAGPGSETPRCTIQLRTYETPPFAQSASPMLWSCESRPIHLRDVHPMYSVHEQIANSSGKCFNGHTQLTINQLAHQAFSIADAQFPGNSLQFVQIAWSHREEDRFRRYQTPESMCQVRLDRSQYEQCRQSMLNYSSRNGQCRAYIALGSNVGDRISLIEAACRAMSQQRIEVTRTSALYETKAMYLEDQDPFINGACEASRFQNRNFCISC